MIFDLVHLSAENGVSISCIRQHQGEGDCCSPEGKSEGFVLGSRFPESDAGRDSIRIKGSNESEIPG